MMSGIVSIDTRLGFIAEHVQTYAIEGMRNIRIFALGKYVLYQAL